MVRQSVDDYQALLFPVEGVILNLRHSTTSMVAWEVDSTFGIDDVVVSYDPFRIDGGSEIIEECFQVKFHILIRGID